MDLKRVDEDLPAGACDGFTWFHGWPANKEAPLYAGSPIYHERMHLI